MRRKNGGAGWGEVGRGEKRRPPRPDERSRAPEHGMRVFFALRCCLSSQRRGSLAASASICLARCRDSVAAAAPVPRPRNVCSLAKGKKARRPTLES